MNVNSMGSNGLELVKSQMEAAKKAKAEAAQKEAEAAALSQKKAAEAKAADEKSTKINTELAAITEKANNANMKVNTAQQAYNNALSQLAMAQAGGDESAIASAKDAVNRAYEDLKKAQQDAANVSAELEAKRTEAQKAEAEAITKQEEAQQAEADAAEARQALENANNQLTTAAQQYETALKQSQEAEKASETKGVQEAEHLSQEEIDKLVSEEGYTYITSQEQFLEIFQNGKIDLNGKYILGCNIDLSSVENWQPVGDEENPFRGVFNGNGYTIDNLTIEVTDDNAENVGFFGVTENAVITDVNFTNASVITPDDYINGSSAVGIVAGTARGTEFDNITISGSVTGYESVGGLAGKIDDNSYWKDENTFITVNNSSISNVDTAVDIKGKYFAGGLAGYVEDTSTAGGAATRDLIISNCNTSGNIVFEEESAGGMIGEAGKTIITINNCQSSTNIVWNNAEDDSDISFLMETGRAGGFIGCVNGAYIAICNSEYSGNLDVDGDFKGSWYGWYMNDSHVTVYELPGGLPIDDILNIDGIDGLTPITDPATGINHYEVTVSTLTGLDKMVTMIQKNPSLAELITFNVNFDFEAMDGMYDQSIYEQYGVVQHLYEDEEGNVHNDVYIDNEVDLETTFHYTSGTYVPNLSSGYTPTMVSGLLKDESGQYVVTTDDGLKNVNLAFNYDNQVTNVTQRLDSDEVRFREYITSMVLYYQEKMHNALKALFNIGEDKDVPKINKAEYKKLQKMAEAGKELTDEQKYAMSVYELDYTVANSVSKTTHNFGCGMGGDASFLDETKAIQMLDEEGRPLFTTLKGDQLRQRMDAEGNLLTDDEGNPIYENLDGSDYVGANEVFAQRGYPKTDEDGNFLYTDIEGNSITKSLDEEGNPIYTNADGSAYEGSEEDLTQQLEPYSISDEFKKLEDEMKELLEEVEKGELPAE